MRCFLELKEKTAEISGIVESNSEFCFRASRCMIENVVITISADIRRAKATALQCGACETNREEEHASP